MVLPPFVKFALVGAGGFIVDSLVLLLALQVLDPFSARILSVLAAMTATWLGNRYFTFAERRQPAFMREGLAFFLANGVGALINYAVYSLLVLVVPLVEENPLLGVAAGSIAGMFFNYAASSRLVFRKLEKNGR